MAGLAPGLRNQLTRAERMVGWFVTFTVIALLAGFCAYVYDTAKRKGTFEPKAYYQTSIRDAAGLKVGDPVKMMGFDVGEITAVIPNEPYAYYNVTIEFFVRQGGDNRYFDYIWTDSRAKIASADILGNRFVEIIKGSAGLRTVWQPDSEKQEFMRLDQMANISEDREKLKYWAEETYVEELVRYGKWQKLRGMLEFDVENAGINLAQWQTWAAPDASFRAAAGAAIDEAWNKAVAYDDWKAPGPYLGHLADALTKEQLAEVYPHPADAPGDYRDPDAPKPYYLDSEESKALGDVITEVADQVASVVGKEGAIGDLLINEYMKTVVTNLTKRGAVADLVMNDEVRAVMANIENLTQSLTNKGAVADMMLNEELGRTVNEITETMARVKSLADQLDTALRPAPAPAPATGPAKTNDINTIVNDLGNLLSNVEGITSSIDRELAANTNLVSQTLEIANSMKDLARTIESALGQNPELVGNVSKLTAEIDGFMQLLSRHWLFRKAAEQQTKDIEEAWEAADVAILKVGALANALDGSFAAPAVTVEAVRPKATELESAAVNLAARSDKVGYLVTDNPTRTGELAELAVSALGLAKELNKQLAANPELGGNVKDLGKTMKLFLKKYEENAVAREARRNLVEQTGAAQAEEDKPKRKFFRRPSSSRGQRGR